MGEIPTYMQVKQYFAELSGCFKTFHVLCFKIIAIKSQEIMKKWELKYKLKWNKLNYFLKILYISLLMKEKVSKPPYLNTIIT